MWQEQQLQRQVQLQEQQFQLQEMQLRQQEPNLLISSLNVGFTLFFLNPFDSFASAFPFQGVSVLPMAEEQQLQARRQEQQQQEQLNEMRNLAA